MTYAVTYNTTIVIRTIESFIVQSPGVFKYKVFSVTINAFVTVRHFHPSLIFVKSGQAKNLEGPHFVVRLLALHTSTLA